MKFYGLICLLGVLLSFCARGEEGLFSKDSGEDFEGKVVVLKIEEDSLINKYAFKYFQKVLKRVKDEKAKAVVFDIDSPGGYAFETADLIAQDMQDLDIPSIAFINPNALSAASWVAWGSGGGEIEPVMRAKVESSLKSYVRIVAKEKGRNPDVMYAMMFKDEVYEFGDVKVAKGELLNLDADQAVMTFEGSPLLAEGVAESLEEVLEKEGFKGVDTVLAEPVGMESFAFWVAKMSPLLIGLGLLGAFLEMKTPGFGIFGGVSLVAFSLFFFGNNVAGNLAGYELAVLFVAGLILVILEFLVIPGTFFAGAIGVVMMLTALVMAMVDREFFKDYQKGGDGLVGLGSLVGWPLVFLAGGLTISMVLGALFLRFLPTLPMYRNLAVDAQLKRGSSISEHVETSELVGQVGTVVAELRPAGKVSVGDELLDVESKMGFVDEGVEVRVVSVDGMRVLVEEVEGAKKESV